MEASIHSHFVGISGGVLMSIIAFSIVFIVIAGLMLLMMGLKCFVSSIDKASAARSAPASAPAAPVVSPAVQAQGAEDSDELLAVISAAIVAACGSSARVVRFAPAPPRTPGTPWRMTGRLQNSEGFGD